MDVQHIERIAEKVGRLDFTDHIIHWDRKQGRDQDEGADEPRFCQVDKKHGRLQMRGDGNALICCTGRGAACSHVEPVSR